MVRVATSCNYVAGEEGVTTGKRSYDQYCPAARALDVVGDRWTLLIVRELLLGPKRYTDLVEGLPGIAPNVLAGRLRELQEADLIDRTTLPPPAASTVYVLTPLGEGLRPVLLALNVWGLHLLGAPKPSESFKPGWLMQTLEATADLEAASGVDESYEFRINGTVFHVEVDDGRVAAREGPAADAALVATTDFETFLALGARRLTAEEAVAQGKLQFEGDPEAGQRAIAILGGRMASLGEPGEPAQVSQ